MAAAIGEEIKTCLRAKTKKDQEKKAALKTIVEEDGEGMD